MIGVFVRLGPSDGLDHARATTVAEQAIPMFEGMPGLRSKAMTWDEEKGIVTNLYIWETEEAARAFHTPELAAMIVDLYGTEPKVSFVEITALIDNGVTSSV